MTISTTHIERADIRFQPAADALKPFVGCFWVVAAQRDAIVRVVPDGTTAISIELRGGFGPEWHLRGPMLRPDERRFCEAATLVGVRLRPGVAYLLSGAPAHAVADRSVRLAEFPAFRALASIDFAGAQPSDCIDTLQRFLLERLGGASVHPVVTTALLAVSDSAGAISIATLADRCGVTARHLHRLMRVWVGYGPKRYATIVRFQSTLGQMEQAPERTPAMLASEVGYFDQAHLTGDIGRFAGATPGRLRTGGVSDFSKTRCDDLP